MKQKPKLLLIGSMTRSVAKYHDGIRERFGGGVAYGARTALALNIPAEIITIGADDIEPGVEELRSQGINIRRIPRKVSNNFYNDYRGKRQFRMKDYIKEPISIEDFEEVPGSKAVIFSPGFYEISSQTLEIFKDRTILLDLGGMTREFGKKDEEGYHLINQVHWDTIDEFRDKVDILKISEDDLENIDFDKDVRTEEEKIQNLAENGFPIVLYTRGAKETIIARKGLALENVPSFPVGGDPGGAGDTFSVGFMAEYLKTKDLVKAVAFGNACASYKVAGEDYDYDKVRNRANQILVKTTASL